MSELENIKEQLDELNSLIRQKRKEIAELEQRKAKLFDKLYDSEYLPF